MTVTASNWRHDGYASNWRNDGIRIRGRNTPGRALDQAERMGLRRLRVADVDRRTIEVQGRKRNGEHVYVTFSRRSRATAPSCRYSSGGRSRPSPGARRNG